MGREGDLVAPRFARGCRCFAVWIDGSLGGYGWLSTGPEWIGELQLEIKPGPGEGYIWNCVTLADHRRKGVFRSLLIGISSLALKDELKRLWLGSLAIPAEKAVEPSGFRPALHLTSLNFGGLHLLMATESADHDLARDAAAALGIKPGVLLRRSRARVH